MEVSRAPFEVRTAFLGGFAGQLGIAFHASDSFSLGGWLAGLVLLIFSFAGRQAVAGELKR